MSINLLFSFFIRPIELVLEFIFSSVYKISGNVGLSVVFVGIIMNILILPIYIRADKISFDFNEKRKRMEPWIALINKAFKGDERFMMTQALYRENNYSSLSVLSGSLSILFEVPFFIAGFHLLSGLRIVEGVSFLFIKDLSLPDGIFSVGAFTVNILPILMTVINLISSFIYTKDQPRSTKIQTYVLAAVFLVLLYDSPSCLVLYWTTNNLFSLIKNIVLILMGEKLKTIKKPSIPKIRLFTYKPTSKDHIITFMGLLFTAVLTGVQVSSDVIGSNIFAFTDINNFIDPNYFVLNSFLIAAGLYVLWGGIIYFMLRDYGKNLMQYLILVYSGICTIDYFSFNSNGTLTTQLVFYAEKNDNMKILLNIFVIVIIFALFAILFKNNKSIATGILAIEFISVTILSFINIYHIEKEIRNSMYLYDQEVVSNINLSAEGKNVIVIMLDKGMGSIIPYILNEDPGLMEVFDGFTFYPNTLSFGPYTMSGSPSLYGGYEYTPDAINQRDNILLRDKQNEALLVMPVNFAQNGFDVTVCDPTMAGYRWIPDCRIYDDYPQIHSYLMSGAFNDYIDGPRNYKIYERNFFCYGLFRTSPLFMRSLLYDDSMFNAADREYYFDFVQNVISPSEARGYNLDFLDAYTTLRALPSLTTFDNENDSFIMFPNNTAHDPWLLSEPSYEPALIVDNNEYDYEHYDRFTVGEQTLNVDNNINYGYYQCLMCSLRELGNWFDYLKENGCYDNTRIIIVADHGNDYYEQYEYNNINLGSFNPLLLVKDFDSHGFTVSDEFMTNAQTPFFAFEGIIDNPVNPSTGNRMVSRLGEDHFEVMFNDDVVFEDIYEYRTFSRSIWYEVTPGNILSPDNWRYEGEW